MVQADKSCLYLTSAVSNIPLIRLNTWRKNLIIWVKVIETQIQLHISLWLVKAHSNWWEVICKSLFMSSIPNRKSKSSYSQLVPRKLKLEVCWDGTAPRWSLRAFSSLRLFINLRLSNSHLLKRFTKKVKKNLRPCLQQ